MFTVNYKLSTEGEEHTVQCDTIEALKRMLDYLQAEEPVLERWAVCLS